MGNAIRSYLDLAWREPVLVTGIELLPSVISPILWALVKNMGRKLRSKGFRLNLTVNSKEVSLTLGWRK